MLWFIIHHTHHSFVNGYGWYGTTLSRLLSYIPCLADLSLSCRHLVAKDTLAKLVY